MHRCIVTTLLRTLTIPFQNLFIHLPQKRRLSPDKKDEAARLLKMRVNRKMLCEHLTAESGRVVTLKYLSNIRADASRGDTRNNLTTVVAQLRKTPGAIVDVVVDDENNLRGIFYQNAQMQNMFAAFPEVLFVDATYKLNELRMPVYILIVEDGNGHSEIVAFWLAASEDRVTIKQMADLVVRHNPCTSQVRVIMGDKDFTEREVFSQTFPQATMLICLYHTLRTFRREITTEKIGITSGEKLLALELLTKLAYAHTNEEYDQLHEQLLSTCPRSVCTYFDHNWHPLRKQWTMVEKLSSGNFLNNTNNILESLNQKVKSVVARYSTLEDLFCQFLLLIDRLRVERDTAAVRTATRVPVLPFESDSPQARFASKLTPYAFTYVKQQLDLASKVANIVISDDDTATCNCSEGVLAVTEVTCQCNFFRAMHLPCRHVFALRSLKGTDLFGEEICPLRWTSAYYRTHQRVLSVSTTAESGTAAIIDLGPRQPRVLSAHEKYGKAFTMAQKIASLASEAPMRDFQQRMSVLTQLVDLWSSSNVAVVVEMQCAECKFMIRSDVALYL